MKNIKYLFLIVSILITNISFAQDYTSFEVENISEEIARKAINQTLTELKLGGHLWKNETTTESNFYNFSTIVAKNRLKVKVVVENNKLSVSIVNRQYKSNGNWVDNPLPMNKKQAAKILNPIKNRFLKLTQSKSI